MSVHVSSSPLSERLNAIEESATIAMSVKARALKAQGHDVVNLTLGEPDFPTPRFIQDAAIEAIRSEKYFSYPPVAGYLDLREAIAAKLQRDNGLSYKAENIVVSAGAKHSIANALMALVNPGDEVIIFAPYWVSYVELVKLFEGVPVIVSGGIENDFKVTGEQVRAALTPRTKAVLFSSPCNPTGSVFSKEELADVAEALREREDVYVLSDEIYEYINFAGEHASIAEIDFMKERTIIINGFSKGHAMTGWRVGYIAAPAFIAKACEKIQGQITSGISSIAQRAALAAVSGTLEEAHKMRDAYLRRRGLVKELLEQIPGLKTNMPEGAFYFFPDVSAFFGKRAGDTLIANADDLSSYLLNTYYLSVVSGSAFGAPNCLRFSFAAADTDLVEGCRRLKEALAGLQ